jgi:hypothetical protein
MVRNDSPQLLDQAVANITGTSHESNAVRERFRRCGGSEVEFGRTGTGPTYTVAWRITSENPPSVKWPRRTLTGGK